MTGKTFLSRMTGRPKSTTVWLWDDRNGEIGRSWFPRRRSNKVGLEGLDSASFKDL